MRYARELPYGMAVSAASEERAVFIRRTYGHLAVAILAFMALEAALMQLVDFPTIVRLLGGSMWGPLMVLLAFMGASWLAQTWARSSTSRAMQYAGLSLYVVAEALIILPLLVYCQYKMGPSGIGLIGTAGILTLAVFAGLTLTVFATGKDFSFLGPVLWVGSFLALGLIVAAIVFHFAIGVFFSFAMVALMAGFILYETSQVLHHFRTDQYVAAALDLFASVATMFYWILRILLLMNQRN
jgi:FtsH-binding integral membrane protein